MALSKIIDVDEFKQWMLIVDVCEMQAPAATVWKGPNRDGRALNKEDQMVATKYQNT